MGNFSQKRKDLLKMQKIKKVAAVMSVMVLASCVCQNVGLEVAAAGIGKDLRAKDVIDVTSDVINVTNVVNMNAKSKDRNVEWDSSQYGVTAITGATEDDLGELIEKIIDYRGMSYCPFKGKGDVLKSIEDDYGISPIAMLAMWTWESGFGTSSLAINNHNYGGIKGGNGGYRYFETISEGMIFQGKLIRESYVDQGYDTYALIASKYCPGNYEWSGNVSGSAQKYAGWLEDIMD